MRFAKYHVLGNDYLVIPPQGNRLKVEEIRRLCHRHHGAGADGIMWGPWPHPEADAAVRIFNPDGGEAEISGNGLAIFARYCSDEGEAGPWKLATPTRTVTAYVAKGGNPVTIDLGPVQFDSPAVPIAGPPREVLDETLSLSGRSFEFSAVVLGNPHCVIRRPRVTAAEARTWGPLVERDGRFPHRINVQFVEVLDRANIKIEIWERGAGYTTASGSSSCAAAAVAVRHGWCDRDVTVHMPGGSLKVRLDEAWRVTLTAVVTPILRGRFIFDII